MSRIVSLLLSVGALALMGAEPGSMSPAARVLAVKGKATVVESIDYNRPAAIYGTIYADERLVVAKDARVTLVFRSDGHVERIAAPGTFRVTPAGCQPRKGVEQVAMPEQSRTLVGKISKGPRGIVQGGVVVARSAAPPPKDNGSSQESGSAMVARPGLIRPIPYSTLLAAKPAFSWPAAPKAKKYTLNLYFLGNRVWSAVSETTRLEYSGDTALKPGAMYSWEVTTALDGKTATVCEGAFTMASDRQRADAKALQPLAAKPEPLYLAVAALWYKQNGLLAEAVAINERLVKLTPDAGIYRELAELYFQVGRDQDALDAEAKANALQKAGKESGAKGEEKKASGQ